MQGEVGGSEKFCLGWGQAEIFRIHRYVNFVYSILGLEACSFQMQLFVEDVPTRDSSFFMGEGLVAF